LLPQPLPPQLLRPGIILLRPPKKPAPGERVNKYALVPYSTADFEQVKRCGLLLLNGGADVSGVSTCRHNGRATPRLLLLAIDRLVQGRLGTAVLLLHPLALGATGIGQQSSFLTACVPDRPPAGWALSPPPSCRSLGCNRSSLWTCLRWQGTPQVRLQAGGWGEGCGGQR